ncbi:hypothetical protein [Wenzhou hepe-like virus 1]|uniref:hypothetical protein n=1 Tax=Wenzhou hepe-like virus 1 TaxID=1923566 RepID=UPI00090CD5EF|nr:hypothetical protein [Wenzhou hepe-like virus 1]APG77842.1 hypothetical protein [Wenzhou hepe-like virus 1]APG77847.1 hypothetical protein [Wenzhou hepe-like virus 1]
METIILAILQSLSSVFQKNLHYAIDIFGGMYIVKSLPKDAKVIDSPIPISLYKVEQYSLPVMYFPEYFVAQNLSDDNPKTFQQFQNILNIHDYIVTHETINNQKVISLTK